MNGKKAKQDSGVAFITVIAFIFMSMGLMLMLNKKIGMLIIASGHEPIPGQEGKYISIARALSVLQTGTPATSPEKYSITLTDHPNEPVFSVSYVNISSNTWSVSVSSTSESLPALPGSF